jgi:hypothetical protein
VDKKGEIQRHPEALAEALALGRRLVSPTGTRP